MSKKLQYQPTRLTLKEFIQKAQNIHQDKYDYSKVNYINMKTDVDIICREHGLFKQKPNSHLRLGSGCFKCGIRKRKNIASTTEEFIRKAKEIHGDKYDYSKVVYVNAKTKVNIICKEHGIFQQRPLNHIMGYGCSKCGFKKNSFTNKEFISKARKIHGDRYDYSKVIYVNSDTKVNIICIEHGIFQQTSYDHLKGSGCSRCNDSKGETEISKFLNLNKIQFIHQCRFNDCRDTYVLPFDFYLPKYNICIEFDGVQHYKPIEYFGGFEAFKNIQKHDLIKTNYCLQNNIKLIRILDKNEIRSNLEFII